jgi:hypothetical protein
MLVEALRLDLRAADGRDVQRGCPAHALQPAGWPSRRRHRALSSSSAAGLVCATAIGSACKAANAMIAVLDASLNFRLFMGCFPVEQF